ncbi:MULTISPECIES: DUF4253 domain-containing protein [unclassified Streptomyces]|uniref:DUF4253 domain-containing protein n=1 Tax=unclassified Streptomyces TaxID=2593676 RepID=UPI0035D86CB8
MGAHARTLHHDNDTAGSSAVVRSREERFGVCVVGLGFSTLHLGVAAPPATLDDAVAVAAEHFAFCPDVLRQGTRSTLAAYAESLVGLNCREFWWD